MLINGLYPESMAGIEKIGADMAARLAGKHNMMVYSGYLDYMPERELRDGYSITRIKSSYDYRISLPLGVRTVNSLRELRKEKQKPDVILAMSISNGFVGYLAKKIFKIPYVIYVLGVDWYIARDDKTLGTLFKHWVKNCDTLLTQTNIIKREVMEHLPNTEVEVVPNGISLPGKRAHGDKIVYLGRLAKVKGVEFLIEAVRGIENCRELLIAGTGPEEENLRNAAAGLNVRFLGRVQDVEDCLLQGKFIVLPSLSEGLPQVMLEAMSYGLPVIASRVGGIPDVIEHGKTGFLVEPENSEDIRKHIKILLSDDDLCQEMGKNCLNEAEKYTWDKIAEKIENILQKSAGRRVV